MGVIQFQISEELIRSAMAFPKDSKIVKIEQSSTYPFIFRFYLEHTSFPEVQGVQTPIEVSPVIYADYEKQPDTWLTIDFRIPFKQGK